MGGFPAETTEPKKLGSRKPGTDSLISSLKCILALFLLDSVLTIVLAWSRVTDAPVTGALGSICRAQDVGWSGLVRNLDLLNIKCHYEQLSYLGFI